MAKVTIVIEDKTDGNMSVTCTPSFQQIAAARLSGNNSSAYAYAHHVGGFMRMGLGKEDFKKNKKNKLIT